VQIGGPTPSLQLNAQGTFVATNKNKPKYRDVTNSISTIWSANGTALTVPNPGATPQGEYIGTAAGCDCVSVTAGGGAVTSQTVTVEVGSPVPACTPCPTPAP
jgi:hypothetical protein